MKRPHILAAIVVVLVIAVGITQITGLVTGVPAQLTPDENPQSAERDISVRIVKGDFSPNRIAVRKGETVRLTLTAQEIDEKFSAHGFAIKEFGISETVAIGESKTITFTPDRSGTFVFFCSVYCGEGHMGQSGVLTVV